MPATGCHFVWQTLSYLTLTCTLCLLSLSLKHLLSLSFVAFLFFLILRSCLLSVVRLNLSRFSCSKCALQVVASFFLLSPLCCSLICLPLCLATPASFINHNVLLSSLIKLCLLAPTQLSLSLAHSLFLSLSLLPSLACCLSSCSVPVIALYTDLCLSYIVIFLHLFTFTLIASHPPPAVLTLFL